MRVLEIQDVVKTFRTPDGGRHTVVDIESFAMDWAQQVALAGASGVYRFSRLDASPELIVSAAMLVGLAFGPRGEMVVASNETAYRFDA